MTNEELFNSFAADVKKYGFLELESELKLAFSKTIDECFHLTSIRIVDENKIFYIVSDLVIVRNYIFGDFYKVLKNNDIHFSGDPYSVDDYSIFCDILADRVCGALTLHAHPFNSASSRGYSTSFYLFKFYPVLTVFNEITDFINILKCSNYNDLSNEISLAISSYEESLFLKENCPDPDDPDYIDFMF